MHYILVLYVMSEMREEVNGEVSEKVTEVSGR